MTSKKLFPSLFHLAPLTRMLDHPRDGGVGRGNDDRLSSSKITPGARRR
jgi:hypothetical protein